MELPEVASLQVYILQVCNLPLQVLNCQSPFHLEVASLWMIPYNLFCFNLQVLEEWQVGSLQRQVAFFKSENYTCLNHAEK